MISKQCRDTRREIDELELSGPMSPHATSHLASCAPCREFQAGRTELRELVGGLEPVVAPADFDMRLRARIVAERSNNRQQPFFARLISTPALAAATLFVIVAGSVVWLAQRQPSVSSGTSNVVATGHQPATAPEKSNQPPVAGSSETASAVGPQVAVNDRNNAIRRRGVRSPQSADYNVGTADSIRQDDLNRAYVPSRPVEFSLQDERGNTRRISLPPVSFGAQSLVDNRTAVNYSPNSRVW